MSDTYCRDCVQHVIHGAGDVEFCPRHAALLALVDDALQIFEEGNMSSDTEEARSIAWVVRYYRVLRGEL